MKTIKKTLALLLCLLLCGFVTSAFAEGDKPDKPELVAAEDTFDQASWLAQLSDEIQIIRDQMIGLVRNTVRLTIQFLDHPTQNAWTEYKQALINQADSWFRLQEHIGIFFSLLLRGEKPFIRFWV